MAVQQSRERTNPKGGVETAPLENGNPLARKHKPALDELFSMAYEDLRRIAGSVKHRGPAVGVSTSTLINEAWIKLVNRSTLELESKLHFVCVAAKAMRQIVVDTARRRGASKRAALFVTFDDALGVAVARNRDVLALDAALEELARLSPRQASVIELRFFGGLDVPEIAEILGVSESTVQREWRAARAWLAVEIRRALSLSVAGGA
jgi:RNA polymerase sigma factor (TIGR02999 family)